MAVARQIEIDAEKEADRIAEKKGELRRSDRSRQKKNRGGNRSASGGGRRRSFNEGSNNRRPGGGSRLHPNNFNIQHMISASSSSSAPVSRPPSTATSPPPAAAAAAAATAASSSFSRVPQTTTYRYPNEKRMSNVDNQRQAPLVPPSRRKLSEAKEERGFRNGSMSNRKKRQNDEEADIVAQLKVEQILADAARGRAVNGSYGKHKPPSQLWPSNSQKQFARRSK